MIVPSMSGRMLSRRSAGCCNAGVSVVEASSDAIGSVGDPGSVGVT